MWRMGGKVISNQCRYKKRKCKSYTWEDKQRARIRTEIFDVFHAKLNNIIFLLLYIIIVLYRYSLFLNVISRMNPILINIFLEFYKIYLRESSRKYFDRTSRDIAFHRAR